LGKRRGLATDEGARKIGALLSQLRKKRGVTQVEMAAKLGVSQSIVSKYEKGELRLHAELIVRLAQVLRVSADQLLGIKEVQPVSPPSGSSERGLWKKLRLVAQLPERDQRAVLRLINSVAANAALRKAG
jgi:transcriptional regulator with XRE-family HTH domain